MDLYIYVQKITSHSSEHIFFHRKEILLLPWCRKHVETMSLNDCSTQANRVVEMTNINTLCPVRIAFVTKTNPGTLFCLQNFTKCFSGMFKFLTLLLMTFSFVVFVLKLMNFSGQNNQRMKRDIVQEFNRSSSLNLFPGNSQ